MLDPDGVVTPDFSGKAPGRGAWVAASSEALRAAVRKSAFARSFKQRAVAPDGLENTVATGLSQFALNALGLARRVGDAVIGYDQVANTLKAKKAVALVSASDGAAGGVRKLRNLANGVPVCDFFESRDLSAALGRAGIVHVALKRGAAAQRFMIAAQRFEGFRPRVEPAASL